VVKIQLPLEMVRETNKLQDAGRQKNCGNATAFSQTPCRNMKTFLAFIVTAAEWHNCSCWSVFAPGGAAFGFKNLLLLLLATGSEPSISHH